MRVESARAAAVDWVLRHASPEPWFRGAYFGGSTVGLPPDAELPPTSDLDVFVVTAGADPPSAVGKIVYRGTLLEVSHLPEHLLGSAEEVLTHYHLAASLRADSLIADPTGRLRLLQADVSRHFAEEVWVRRRCEHARQRSAGRLAAMDASAPWHEQVTSWLFGTGVTTHVLLVAALRNPTVRLRYRRAAEVLLTYGHADLYPELLRLLGCADISPERVEQHIAALARTFDAAAAACRTPYRFRSDISPEARPIAIEGSRDLVQSGWHREAVFWIAATFARCQAILTVDAPDEQRALAPAFDAVLADLGILSTGDLRARAEVATRFLPRLWETAEAILSANPEIVRA